MPKSNVILTQDQATKLQQIYNIIIPLQASSWIGDAAPYQYRVNLTDMTDTQMPNMFLVAAGEDFTQDELDTYELLDNPQTYNGYLIIPTKAGAAKPSKDITVRMEGLTVPGDTSAAGVAALQGEVEGLKTALTESNEEITQIYGFEANVEKTATISHSIDAKGIYTLYILHFGNILNAYTVTGKELTLHASSSNRFIEKSGNVEVWFPDSTTMTAKCTESNANLNVTLTKVFSIL